MSTVLWRLGCWLIALATKGHNVRIDVAEPWCEETDRKLAAMSADPDAYLRSLQR